MLLLAAWKFLFSDAEKSEQKGKMWRKVKKKYLKNEKGFFSFSQQMLLLLSMVMVGLTAMEFPDVVTSPLERPQMLEPTILVAVASFSAPGMWTQS